MCRPLDGSNERAGKWGSWWQKRHVSWLHSARSLRSANAYRWEGTMTTKHLRVAAIVAALLQFGATGLASAASPGKSVEIATKFPDRFPVIKTFYLGKPVIGFGSDVGRVEHVPVIFLHGNNDTPFATACNPFGRMQAFAQFFLDNGYRPSELWGLG